MHTNKLGYRFFLTLLAVSLSLIISTPVFSADKIIARLTDFSGAVLIRSHGSWEVDPEKDLPLYSEDKLVTRIGTATVTFNDGAVLVIKNNSNLLIREQEGDWKKIIKRRLCLIFGKIDFKTGRLKKAETVFETPTAICGLRGTSGTLSIGADGMSYIQFTTGGPKYTAGDFISGVAKDLPQDLADKSPVQRAAWLAKAAADQAKRAEEKAAAATGTPEEKKAQAQLAYARAQAAKAAAEEAYRQAKLMAENNPDSDTAQYYRDNMTIFSDAIAAAKAAMQEALEAGATPGEPEAYEEPEEAEAEAGFDIPVDKEPPISDTEPGSPT